MIDFILRYIRLIIVVVCYLTPFCFYANYFATQMIFEHHFDFYSYIFAILTLLLIFDQVIKGFVEYNYQIYSYDIYSFQSKNQECGGFVTITDGSDLIRLNKREIKAIKRIVQVNELEKSNLKEKSIVSVANVKFSHSSRVKSNFCINTKIIKLFECKN